MMHTMFLGCRLTVCYISYPLTILHYSHFMSLFHCFFLHSQTATPFLIGTKYDYFSNLKSEEKKEMTLQARRFAKAMKAPLIFCSASHAINIHKIFKIVLAKVFDLKCTVEQITTIGDPIIEYEQTSTTGDDGQSNPSTSSSSSSTLPLPTTTHERNSSIRSNGSTDSDGQGKGGHERNASVASNQ